MINLSGVDKSYGKTGPKAVDGLSLEVKRGELFGFLGPNGAGKTTTIKLLVGLLRPDAGDVRVAGLDVVAETLAAKRKIGYVPDEPVLYESMTGSRFLRFIADVYGVPNEKRGRIAELAEKFELTDALRDPISTYSHGMKQKTAIIAALVHEPDVFILDEPIQGLDPRSAFLLKEMMRDHCAKGGTVFFSTHVMEVAERLCDRVGIIRRGSMIASGPLADLRERAGSTDATLENLFLELTDEIAHVN